MHIDFDWVIPPDPFHFPFLEHPQQLGLQHDIQFPDFIQENGAALGQFKFSHLAFKRSGKSAFFIAE